MIFLISYPHVVFFLFEVNKCPSEQDPNFNIGFSLFDSDQDRMERNYKIRECLTAILIGVCSMNLWLVWKVFFFYYFVFL